MRRIVVALASGTLFGAGLAVSGMLDPVRVRSFLDLFGHWDPTLAFVMGGAIVPMAFAWIIQRRLEKPLAEARFHLPDTTRLTPSLIGGAALFGIGWGIAGLCPGPAISNLTVTTVPAALFVAAMFGGMLVHRLLPAIPAKQPTLEN